jgi:integrase
MIGTQRPGIKRTRLKRMANRNKGRKTRYPGVRMLGEGRAIGRFEYPCPKTSKTKEKERIFENVRNAAHANELLQELREKTLKDLQGPAVRQRLHDVVKSWLAEKEKELKRSTFDRYENTLFLHVLPKLGDTWLDMLTHDDIVMWRNEQNDKASTINSRLRVLKTVLADATAKHNLMRDPALRVPALREGKKGAKRGDDSDNTLSQIQFEYLLQGAKRWEPKWFPLIAVLGYTGARIGEATALRWEDLVWPTAEEPRGQVWVERGHYRGAVDTTKTDTYRAIAPEKELWPILREHRDHLGLWTFRSDQKDARRAKMSAREIHERNQHFVEQGWIFPCGDKNKPMFTSVLRKPLLHILDELEKLDLTFGEFRVHGLRRTFNNLVRKVTKDGTVTRSMTGHKTPGMMDHYSTVSLEERAEATSRAFSWEGKVRPVLPNSRADAASTDKQRRGRAGVRKKAANG